MSEEAKTLRETVSMELEELGKQRSGKTYELTRIVDRLVGVCERAMDENAARRTEMENARAIVLPAQIGDTIYQIYCAPGKCERCQHHNSECAHNPEMHCPPDEYVVEDVIVRGFMFTGTQLTLADARVETTRGTMEGASLLCNGPFASRDEAIRVRDEAQSFLNQVYISRYGSLPPRPEPPVATEEGGANEDSF